MIIFIQGENKKVAALISQTKSLDNVMKSPIASETIDLDSIIKSPITSETIAFSEATDSEFFNHFFGTRDFWTEHINPQLNVI